MHSHLGFELIGLLAGSLTTFCWVPQAARILRSHDTAAISLGSQLAFTAGCALWTVYGAMLGSPSIVLFNVLSTSFAATIAVLKVRFG